MRWYLLATLVLAVFSAAAVQTQDNASQALPEVDVAGCLASKGKYGTVIGSAAELYQAVGRNANLTKCRERLEALGLDFETYTLAGITVLSGHCTRPKDMRAVLRRDDEKMMLDAVVTMGPALSPCRGLQEFEIWVLVPREQGYAVRIFDGRTVVAE